MYKVIKEDYIVDLLEEVTYVKFLRGTTKRTITDITNADGFVGSDKKTVYILQGKNPPAGYENNVAQLVMITADEYETLQNVRKTSKTILVNPNSLRDIRETKIRQLSDECKDQITKGVSVMLSDRFNHQFTLTIEDQLNLEGLMHQIDRGVKYLIYHENDCVSKMYTAKDIKLIYQAAFEHKQLHQLRFNCLKYCVNNLFDVDIINSICYTDDISSIPVSDKIKQKLEVLLNG